MSHQGLRCSHSQDIDDDAEFLTQGVSDDRTHELMKATDSENCLVKAEATWTPKVCKKNSHVACLKDFGPPFSPLVGAW